MFEIVDNENKRVTISLHMEEIYSHLPDELMIEAKIEFFRQNEISEFCLDNLVNMRITPNMFENYECILDFSWINSVFANQKRELSEWMNKWRNIKLYFPISCNREIKSEWGKKYKLAEISYCDAFRLHAKKYILENCYEPEGYVTQTGTTLGVYINLKKIIENTRIIFQWCYMIACGLYENEHFKKKKNNGAMAFFCHTMNGCCIAGVLSVLLACDLVYVDHLGPYNKLNKIDFHRDSYESREYVIISDMVCQGNEILRAKNIVEYLGGEVCGYAGFVKLDISNIHAPKAVESFALVYSPMEASAELKYTITTKLCDIRCEYKKEGEEGET